MTSIIIGEILAGYGVGLLLREGASGGGQDILGVYFMQKITIKRKKIKYGGVAKSHLG